MWWKVKCLTKMKSQHSPMRKKPLEIVFKAKYLKAASFVKRFTWLTHAKINKDKLSPSIIIKEQKKSKVFRSKSKKKILNRRIQLNSGIIE